MIADDLNAKYAGWESINNNFAGTTLKEYLLQLPFIIFNDGSGTRISVNINYISCPDVTLIKSSLYTFSWNVGDDPIGSDHLPIKISIKNKSDSSSSENSKQKRPSLF